MRTLVTALIVISPLAAFASTAAADPPPAIDHQRCAGVETAKMHAPEDVALGPLDAVSLALGCPVG